MTIYAIDFDGTVVDHCFPQVGEDVPGAIQVMRKMIQRGDKLILWTMRSGEYLEDAKKWYSNHGVELFGVNHNPAQDSWTSSPKCYAHVYIDDAAFGAPLMQLAKFHRPCIDWDVVDRKLFTGDK